MQEHVSQPAPGAVAGWLKDAPFDLGLIGGVLLVAGIMSALTVVAPSLFLPMLAVHTWVLGYDHVAATFTKLAGLPEDRRRYRALIFYLPGLVLAVMLLIGTRLGPAALLTLYFFGQFFHTTRQSWGLAQRYRHKAGGLPWDDQRLSELTLWSVPLWGFLHRCAQQPPEFLYQELLLPRVPWALVHAAGAVCAGLCGVWVVTRVQAFLRGELALGHTLYLLSHFTVYAAGYVLIRDVNSGWLLVNVWHNAQYLGFVWLHNRQRFAGGLHPEARALSWLSQPGYGRALTYYLALMALSIPFYLLLLHTGERLDGWLAAGRRLPGHVASMAAVASLTLNFHHYLVDGIIWKRRRDPAATAPRPERA